MLTFVCGRCYGFSVTLRPFTDADDGKAYALGKCNYCNHACLMTCSCGREFLYSGDGLKCSYCDLAEVILCQATPGTTYGNT